MCTPLPFYFILSPSGERTVKLEKVDSFDFLLCVHQKKLIFFYRPQCLPSSFHIPFQSRDIQEKTAATLVGMGHQELLVVFL